MGDNTLSFDLASELGFSFRHIHDNAAVAEAIRHCGADTVDLSACHVNFDDPAQQEQALAAYHSAGVRVTGIGVVRLRPDDQSWNRRFFAFARQAGCGVVSITFPPDRHDDMLRGAEALCEEFGMRAAIHNHGGGDWMGNSQILDYLFRRTGNSIGLCLDTAWCLHAGESPVAWLEKFGARLFALHFKRLCLR